MPTSFQRHVKEGIEYYTIPSFEGTGLVIHGFSGKSGGVSGGTYNSLNLSILTEDKLENVLENRRRFSRVLGIDPASMVGAHQVHRDTIYQVTLKDKGRGAFAPETVIPATDALITNEPGLALTAFFADCVPVFFLDPIKKTIALAHAGWKGTVAKIAAKTVKALAEAYGTDTQDLLVAIGPSIGPCHYEVDSPVMEKVKEAFPEDWPSLLTGLKPDGHGQFNLWLANYCQLVDAGVFPENITLAGICTYCHQDILFSHRAGMAGRQAAIIMLK